MTTIISAVNLALALIASRNSRYARNSSNISVTCVSDLRFSPGLFLEPK